jgi:sec-independent protein translocase protein TatA
MFGLRMPELIVILVVALLIFGPKRLPEMGSSIGKSIKEFRKGMSELNPMNAREEVVVPPTPKPSAIEALDSEVASKKAAYAFHEQTAGSEAVQHETVTSTVGSSEEAAHD